MITRSYCKRGALVAALALTFAAGSALTAPQFVYAAKSEPVDEFVLRDKSFPEKPPVKANRKIKKALAATTWVMSEPMDNPLVLEKEKANTVTIMGEPEVTQRQMIRYIKRKNPAPKLNCTVTEIVRLYYEEAGREGIRPDVALCQALKETGFFKYGGDVIPKQNNFCGLGTIGGGIKGAFFATPQLGVRAHIQHLKAYATKEKPSLAIVDPRYEHIVKNRPELYGSVQTWTGLNGQWAVPGKTYGQDILNMWRQAKAPDGEPETLIFATMDIRRSPDSAAAYIYRGIAYYNGERYDDAIADYTKSLELMPTVEGYYNRALCYEKKKDYKHALLDYNKGIALDEKFSPNIYNRGIIYLGQGKENAAIDDFDRVLALEARTTGAVVGKAIAYMQMKKYDKAWHTFYEAAQINTEDEVVKANRDLLEKCYAAK